MSTYRRAACVAMMRPTCSGMPEPYEVFLVRRNPNLRFMGGFDVFPGGTVDLQDQAFSKGNAQTSDAFHCAALRELFEECGILLTGDEYNIPPLDLREKRLKLLAGELSWAELLQNQYQLLDDKALIPFGRWLTPAFSSLRFDAHYFAIIVPPNLAPEIIHGELVAGQWLSPSQAIQKHETGKCRITFPVLETLKIMSACKGNLQLASNRLMGRSSDTYQNGGAEMMEGVHILMLPSSILPPHQFRNTYILGRRQAVVVDPATDTQAGFQSLLNYLQLQTQQGLELTAIWLTKAPEDSITTSIELQQKLKIPICAHPQTLVGLGLHSSQVTPLNNNETHRLQINNLHQDQWQIIHTPGLTSEHLTFYEKTKKCIVLGELLSNQKLESSFQGKNRHQYQTSLLKLRNLKIGIGFRAHGPALGACHHSIDIILDNLTRCT